jgi:hypothetical protein
MMRKQILTAAAVAGFAVSTVAAAVDIGDNTIVGGQVFLDVSHITNQHHGVDVNPTGTGFDIKRGYLIVDHKFNDIFSADLTTDVQFSTASTAVVTTPTGTTTALTNQNTSGGVTEVMIKLVTYSASVLDGGGYKNPTRTKDVDFEGAIGVTPIEWLTVGAGFYSGHLGQVTQATSSFASNTATRIDGLGSSTSAARA